MRYKISEWLFQFWANIPLYIAFQSVYFDFVCKKTVTATATKAKNTNKKKQKSKRLYERDNDNARQSKRKTRQADRND